jgi:predicted short-subunit dehydrogenase-like oxidoreductase (DUF2520 family)
MTSVRIIGPGRAGLSFARALAAVGIEVRGVLGRTDEVGSAAAGVDMLLLAVPDRAIAAVASIIRPEADTVVAHCSGALGLDVLGAHERVALIHPLSTLPDPFLGAGRLRSGGYFAVAGDQLATDVVTALGGRPLFIPAQARPLYHAAACVASNHLVALLGQVERMAASIGLPLEAFLPLARGALDDVGRLGPKAALTGPAARGDLFTLERHRRAVDPGDLAGYDAGVALARRLATYELPEMPEIPGMPELPEMPGRTEARPLEARREGAVDAELAGIVGTGSWR